MSENSIKPGNSYTEGPILKKMLLFALPIIATSIILQLFNTFDMAVAGRFISKEALAAIGSTSTISGFFIEFFLGFSTASNVIIAQLLGKGNTKKTIRAVKTAVIFALYSGIFIAVCGFVSARSVLNMMSVPDNILNSAAQYLKIYFTGMPFFMLYNFCSAICRSKGDTKTPMICLVSGGILKLTLNMIFVKVFSIGVTGMAISTVCSNALSAILLIIFLRKRNDELKLSVSDFRMDKNIVLSLLKIGLPSAFLGSVFSISNMCIQSAINSLGSNAIAASSAAASIEIYIQFFGNAFAQAATTFTSQNYGARKFGRLNKITLLAIALCDVVSLILTAVTFIFSNSLLRIFVTDSAVIALALTRMKYTLLFKPIQAVMDIMTGCLQGYGYTLVPAIVSVFGVCGIRLLWIYTAFAKAPGMEMLMIIYPITQTIAAIIHSVCYIRLKKRIVKNTYGKL